MFHSHKIQRGPNEPMMIAVNELLPGMTYNMASLVLDK